MRTNIAQNPWERSKEIIVDMETSTLLRTIILRAQDVNTRREVLQMTDRRKENGLAQITEHIIHSVSDSKKTEHLYFSSLTYKYPMLFSDSKYSRGPQCSHPRYDFHLSSLPPPAHHTAHHRGRICRRPRVRNQFKLFTFTKSTSQC